MPQALAILWAMDRSFRAVTMGAPICSDVTCRTTIRRTMFHGNVIRAPMPI